MFAEKKFLLATSEKRFQDFWFRREPVRVKGVAIISDLHQRSPAFLAPGTGFVEDSFSATGAGMVLGCLKHVTLIVHFISIIML